MYHMPLFVKWTYRVDESRGHPLAPSPLPRHSVGPGAQMSLSISFWGCGSPPLIPNLGFPSRAI